MHSCLLQFDNNFLSLPGFVVVSCTLVEMINTKGLLVTSHFFGVIGVFSSVFIVLNCNFMLFANGRSVFFFSVAISCKFLDEHIMCVDACMLVCVGYRHWLFFVLFVVHDCTGELIGSLKLSLLESLSFMKMCTTHYFLLESLSHYLLAQTLPTFSHMPFGCNLSFVLDNCSGVTYFLNETGQEKVTFCQYFICEPIFPFSS